jgi:hypothetical protein
MSYTESNLIAQPSRLNWQQGCRAIAHSRFWFVLLLSLATVSNVIYTCTVPLAGVGAIAGSTLPRRRALQVILSMWFVNQLLGFTVRQYPWTLSTFVWGPILLLGAVLSGVLAWQKPRFSQRGFTGYSAWLTFALVAGFVVYQLVIAIASLGMGGLEHFTPQIVWDVFRGNAIWAIALTIVHSVLVWDHLREQQYKNRAV